MRSSRPKTKITVQLEIEYKFHPPVKRDEHYERVHWMYASVSGADITECKDNAKKYFEKQMRELGWTKITTLTEIRPLGNTNDPPKHKSNSSLSDSRKPTPAGKGTPRKTTAKKPSRRRTTSKRTTS